MKVKMLEMLKCLQASLPIGILSWPGVHCQMTTYRKCSGRPFVEIIVGMKI